MVDSDARSCCCASRDGCWGVLQKASSMLHWLATSVDKHKTVLAAPFRACGRNDVLSVLLADAVLWYCAADAWSSTCFFLFPRAVHYTSSELRTETGVHAISMCWIHRFAPLSFWKLAKVAPGSRGFPSIAHSFRTICTPLVVTCKHACRCGSGCMSRQQPWWWCWGWCTPARSGWRWRPAWCCTVSTSHTGGCRPPAPPPPVFLPLAT